jgi:hypothetical protein
MTIPQLFFTFLTVAAIGYILAFINVATAMTSIFKDGIGSAKAVFIRHAICAFLYLTGGLGAIGYGIAWIVTYLKH